MNTTWMPMLQKNILKYKSVGNTDYRSGVVCKLNEKYELDGNCSNNCEAIIELKVLKKLKG